MVVLKRSVAKKKGTDMKLSNNDIVVLLSKTKSGDYEPQVKLFHVPLGLSFVSNDAPTQKENKQKVFELLIHKLDEKLPMPQFLLNEEVEILSANEKADNLKTGFIHEIIWHDKNKLYNYCITDINRSMVSKKYLAADLQKV